MVSLPRTLLFPCLVMMFVGGSAYPSETPRPWLSAAELRAEFEAVVPDPLPLLDRMIPGYIPPPADAPSLLVGGFQGATQQERDWGAFLGLLLRWKIAFLPGIHLITPPTNWETLKGDLWQPGIPWDESGRSLTSLSLAYERYGVETVLVGDLSLSDSTFELTAILHALPDGRVVSEARFAGALADLPGGLVKVSAWVLEELLPNLPEESRKHLEEMNPPSLEILEEAFEVNQNADSWTPEERSLRTEALWRKDHRLPHLSETYFSSVSEMKKAVREDFNEVLRSEADSRFPDHPGVMYNLARWCDLEESSEAETLVRRLRGRIVTLKPGYIPGMMMYAEHLSTHEENPMVSLSVLLGLIETFPRNFRVWWTASYCSHLLGKKFQSKFALSDEISDEVGGLFAILQQLDFLGMSKAAAIHPTSSDLWKGIMYQVQRTYGPSGPYMQAFRNAVKYGPDDPAPYEILELHTRGMWGVEEIQFEALESALKNIPENKDAYSRLFRRLVDSPFDRSVEPPSRENLRVLDQAAERIAPLESDSSVLKLCLGVFTWSQNIEAGAALIDRWVKSKSQIDAYPAHSWMVIERAVDFRVPDLAMELFDKTNGQALVRFNQEDCHESTKALLFAKMGRIEDAKAILEKRILDAEDNLFSMLRYLEIGMEASLDPGVREICVEYLIDYAPPPMQYSENTPLLPNQTPENMLPSYCQDFLRLMAEGHVATAEGNPDKAAVSYRSAVQASEILSGSQVGVLPDVIRHLARVESVRRGEG